MAPDTVRVRDLMATCVPVITPRTTVGTALRLLREHDLPALPVCEHGVYAGLVDERALLRLTPSEATTLDAYEMREVLERLTVARVVAWCAAVPPDAPLRTAASLMLQQDACVVAVVREGRFEGLLTWKALLYAASEPALDAVG